MVPELIIIIDARQTIIVEVLHGYGIRGAHVICDCYAYSDFISEILLECICANFLIRRYIHNIHVHADFH